jgi:hypothetical protein
MYMKVFVALLPPCCTEAQKGPSDFPYKQLCLEKWMPHHSEAFLKKENAKSKCLC